MSTPNYKRIYRDMIRIKYPEKADVCNAILKKRKLNILDVITLNDILLKNTAIQKESKILNQKLKSYDKATIFHILEYQKSSGLNNVQLARHFNLSRNTVAKWKKLYFISI